MGSSFYPLRLFTLSLFPSQGYKLGFLLRSPVSNAFQWERAKIERNYFSAARVVCHNSGLFYASSEREFLSILILKALFMVPEFGTENGLPVQKKGFVWTMQNSSYEMFGMCVWQFQTVWKICIHNRFLQFEAADAASRFFISLCGFSEDIAPFLKISRGLFATSAESWRCAVSVANPRVQFQTWITIGGTLMWFRRSLLLPYLFYPQVGGHDLVLQVLKWEREREGLKHQ